MDEAGACSVARLSDEACRMSPMVRLGLPVVEGVMNLQCVCGYDLETGEHLLGCMWVEGGMISTRHDMVVEVLMKYIREAGGVATHLDHNRLRDAKGSKMGKRPDIRAFLGNDIILIDVTVPHTLVGTCMWGVF